MIVLVRSLQSKIRGLHRAGCGLLFPGRCAFCRLAIHAPTAEIELCRDCISRLGPERWPGCLRCGAPERDKEYFSTGCPNCCSLQLWFDTVVVLGDYHAGLRDAVLKMKRPWHDPLSLAMGRLLMLRRRAELERVEADLIVPIPMYWRRRLGRGKNNPETLADCLAKSLGVAQRQDVLIRRRDTRPQSQLSPAGRFRNVRGAFRVDRPDRIDGKRILLVDDVMTTGATCSEAAKTLRRAGADSVAVVVVARA